MSLPDVSVTVQDGALGIVSASTSNIAVKVGVCSIGTVGQLYSFTDKKTLVATLGTGPLVEAAALSLDTAGGPVYCVPVTASVAGTLGAVTHVGTGSSVVTLSGTTLDEYSLVLTMIAGGANPAANAASFQYSLDGGNTVSAPIAVPSGGVYAIPGTGVTATWSAASLVAGDTYTSAITAPGYSSGDLQTAMGDLLTNPLTWGFVHVVGAPASVSATVSLVATLDTLLNSAAAAFRYAFAILDCAKDTDNNIETGFAGVSSKHVMVGAGTCFVLSSISGLFRERSVAWLAAARCAQVPVSEDLGRVATGPIVGVPAVLPNGASGLVRDEQVTPGLDASRLMTLRTIIGRQGFYITNGNLLAPAGSDFSLVQRRRVMDLACSVARQALLNYLNDSIRVDPNTGFILPSEAAAIQAYVNGQLYAAVVSKGYASAAAVVVSPSHNILSDNTMPVTVRVTPLGYAKSITLDIGFVNPALSSSSPNA